MSEKIIKTKLINKTKEKQLIEDFNNQSLFCLNKVQGLYDHNNKRNIQLDFIPVDRSIPGQLHDIIQQVDDNEVVGLLSTALQLLKES